MKRPNSKQRANRPAKRRFAEAHGSAYDRYLAALRTVIRHLGGSRVVLLASGYRPAEKPGYWLTPHNSHIMWKQRDAIIDIFTGYRWSDRAKLAEKTSMPNDQAQRRPDNAAPSAKKGNEYE